MLRMRRAALALVLTTGCLDPLSDDQPGYSRHILPGDSELPSVSGDPAATRRIDMNDGISMAMAPLKSGFAQGAPVKYWDLGAGRGTAVPAYKLARCDDEGQPVADLDHPLLIDALPGDPDYSQIWAISYVCVTSKYSGQQLPNLLALSDAYELGLALEPEAPSAWRYQPVVLEGAQLEGASEAVGTPVTMFARGMRVTGLWFGADGEVVSSNGKSVSTGNVYELVRPGSTKVERVVFGAQGFDEAGGRVEGYAPVFTVVTATIAADADIATFTRESDIATVNMDRSLTKASSSVISVVATMNRVARPAKFAGEQP